MFADFASDVPRTAPERVVIIKTIINAAKKIGLTDTDFLLDALVMTIAADERNCRYRNNANLKSISRRIWLSFHNGLK